MLWYNKILCGFFFGILSFSTAFSQEVSNVEIQHNSGRVMVSYVLDEAVPSYFVELLYSADQGMTFSEPLKRVSGDVNNVNGGAGKRIIWDAEKELGYFSGEMLFRVKATPLKRAMPSAIFNAKFGVEVKSAVVQNRKLQVEFLLTATENMYLKLWRSSCYLINSSGNSVSISELYYEGVSANEKELLPDLPVKVIATVENYNTAHTNIPKLYLLFREGYKDHNIIFQDVPVTIK